MWTIVMNHEDCPPDRPYAVVNSTTGEVDSFHATMAEAEQQTAALVADGENAPEPMASALIVAAGVLDDGGEGEDADERRDIIRQIEQGNLNGVSVEPAGLDVEEDCVAYDDDGYCDQIQLTFDRYRIGLMSVVTIPAIEGTLIEMDPPGNPGEGRGFRAIIARENISTDEGNLTRYFPAGCFEWGDGPTWPVTAHHDDEDVLGRITSIERVPITDATEPAVDQPDIPVPEAPMVAGATATFDDLVVPTAWTLEPDDLPDLDEPGSRVPVVTADGRVYGWLASWSDCHQSFQDYCQTPWHSPSGYAYAMHSGPFRTDDGGLVLLAPLAASGGHYPTEGAAGRDWRAARRHYDDPNTCAAYVAIGENDRGIWFSGVLRPDAPERLHNLLRRHQLSGDWRRTFGEWELQGVCSVNQPGFVRRAAWAASAAGPLELVAAVVAAAPSQAAGSPCGCGGTCESCRSARGRRRVGRDQNEHEEPANSATSDLLAEMRNLTSAVRAMDDRPLMPSSAPLVEERLAVLEARLAVMWETLEPTMRQTLRSRLNAGG